jgi:hypothetical protein
VDILQVSSHHQLWIERCFLTSSECSIDLWMSKCCKALIIFSYHLRMPSVQVRFQVLTAASMKMTVFWVVASCSLVDVYWHFRGACCLHYQGDWRQQVPPKRRWTFTRLTRRKNPEDSYFRPQCSSGAQLLIQLSFQSFMILPSSIYFFFLLGYL